MTAAAKVAGAAALIAGLTVLARIAGFARTLVFTNTVGTQSDLGSVYQAANALPTILYELVAGGALAGLVVPLLAKAILDGDRRRVDTLASALLTWVLALLVPAAVLVAVLAHPIASVLPGAHHSAEDVDLMARMLRIFAPQLPLYGIGIVLTGVLQAHRRFAWPVIAPLLSSVTVMGAYLAYAVVDVPGSGVAGLSGTGELLLAVGTSAGVAVLSLCLLIPLRRCGVRLRPVWRFPDTSARQAARLGAAGAVTVGTQQLALLTALILAYDAADNLFAPYLAVQAVYLLPWAVLAVPVATAAYPGLAAAHAAGDRAAFGAQVARTTRWVLLLSCLGAAALVAIAGPAAVVLNDPRDAALLVCLAPGLLGYGLFALLSRVLYARHEARAAAVAVALGWAVVIVASIGLAAALPVDRRLPGIAAGNSIGMLVLGVLLLLAVRRRAGAAAIDGAGRAAAVGLLAAVVAGAAGWAAVAGLDGPLDRLPNTAAAVVQVMAGGLVVLVGFIAVMWPLGRRDLEPTVAALRRRLRRRLRRGGPSTDTRPDESGTRADESGGAVGVPSGSAPSDGGAAGAGGPVGAAAGSADRAGPAATAAGAARSATTAVDDGGTTGLPGGQAGGAADGAAGGPAGGAAGGPVGGAAGGAAGGPVGGTAAGSVAENATSGRMSADGGRQRDEDVEGDG